MVIQPAQALLDVFLKIAHAFAVDLVVQHGVAGRALLHEFGEDAGLVGGFPFVGHFGEEQFAHGAPLPERNDLVAIQRARFGADGKRNLLARVEDVQVRQAVAAQFGIGGGGFGRGAFLADDQFICADEDRFVFQQVLKRQRAAQRRRHEAGLLPIGFRHQQRRVRVRGSAWRPGFAGADGQHVH